MNTELEKRLAEVKVQMDNVHSLQNSIESEFETVVEFLDTKITVGSKIVSPDGSKTYEVEREPFYVNGAIVLPISSGMLEWRVMDKNNYTLIPPKSPIQLAVEKLGVKIGDWLQLGLDKPFKVGKIEYLENNNVCFGLTHIYYFHLIEQLKIVPPPDEFQKLWEFLDKNLPKYGNDWFFGIVYRRGKGDILKHLNGDDIYLKASAILFIELAVAKVLNGDWVADWSNEDSYKFFVGYMHHKGILSIDSNSCFQKSDVYYKSEEVAQQALDILEPVLNIKFGVK